MARPLLPSVCLALLLGFCSSRAAANAYNVGEIPQMIPEREAMKLLGARLYMTDDLLREAASAGARKRLARKLGLRAARLEQLVRYADLLRLQNIGPEWVMLLEAAGLKSIPDLARQSPPELTRKAAAVNRARRIADPGPTEAQMRDWISQAAKLPPVLNPS